LAFAIGHYVRHPVRTYGAVTVYPNEVLTDKGSRKHENTKEVSNGVVTILALRFRTFVIFFTPAFG
jgi:hypothetical protein